MIRPLAWLAGLVLALALAEFSLARRDARARAAETRVGTLFTRAEASELRKQPALRVEQGGATHAYGRVRGEWRCLSLFDAPADGRALQSWIDALLSAEGLVHARTVEEAPAYGINTPETVRVSIQGPRATQAGGDVLATLELGFVAPGRASSFVRRKGTKEVWSVAGDLRAPLEARRAPGLPPLLAPSAVPAAWLEQGGGTLRITVEAGSERMQLERRERALDPATLEPGMLPWTWFLARASTDDDDAEVEVAAGNSYAGFLERLSYARVLDPARREERVAAPRARVTLAAREGAPLVLAFGTAGADGRIALWVEETLALYEIEPGDFALAVPRVDELATAREREDPWSAALGGQR